jgi:hypothetical protein
MDLFSAIIFGNRMYKWLDFMEIDQRSIVDACAERDVAAASCRQDRSLEAMQ